MKPRSLLLAVLVGGSGTALHLIDPNMAHAQSSTTGAITGVIKDKATGDVLPGVTVIVTSPALQQSQSAITDDKGEYKVTDLPVGDYLVTFYFADITVERSGIHVGINTATPVYQDIDQSKAGGEVIHVTRVAPTIDPTSTSQGITLDKNYLQNIPVPGRTFDQMLGAAAGSQGDPVTGGVSFSGSTSLENEYVVDGVNTTGLTFGNKGIMQPHQRLRGIDGFGGFDGLYGSAGGEDVSRDGKAIAAVPYTGAMRETMAAIASHDVKRAVETATKAELTSPGDVAGQGRDPDPDADPAAPSPGARHR